MEAGRRRETRRWDRLDQVIVQRDEPDQAARAYRSGISVFRGSAQPRCRPGWGTFSGG